MENGKADQQYVFPTSDDVVEASARGIVFPIDAPWPCPVGSKICWSLPVTLSAPEYKPYSFFVYEYGYTFIEITKRVDIDDIKWGWKLIVENRSKHDARAYAYCNLFDKDGFLLTSNNTDWPGSLIFSGEKTTIQGEEIWPVNRNTKPYHPTRVVKIECTLLLNHSDSNRF